MEKLLAPSFLFFLFIILAIPIVVRGRGTLTDARFVVPQILLSSLLKTIGLNVERGIERERGRERRKEEENCFQEKESVASSSRPSVRDFDDFDEGLEKERERESC